MNARKKLIVQWEPAGELKEKRNAFGKKQDVIIPGDLESSESQYQKMQERSRQPATVLRKDGDPESAFKNAAQVIERTYYASFLAHNCLEPMNFFAHVTDEKALLVGPLQAPGWTEPTLSKILKLPPEKIEIQMTRMGGGFGRRAYGHYLVEAALISRKARAPIKLVYSREDDMTYGIYRPMYTATYRAALDANKNLIAFHVKGGGIPEHPIHANRFPAGTVDNYLAEGWELPKRGKDGKGLYAMKCGNCHQPENLPGLHKPPGNPTWHLPPANMKMVFQGKTPRQLAKQLVDRKQNGNKSKQALLEHAHDALVIAGWNMGEGRSLHPLTHEEFVKVWTMWIEKGAYAPK